MHQSWPGIRLRRVSQPSIHLPWSVNLSAIKIGSVSLSKFSAAANQSSLANKTFPPFYTTNVRSNFNWDIDLFFQFKNQKINNNNYSVSGQFVKVSKCWEAHRVHTEMRPFRQWTSSYSVENTNTNYCTIYTRPINICSAFSLLIFLSYRLLFLHCNYRLNSILRLAQFNSFV